MFIPDINVDFMSTSQQIFVNHISKSENEYFWTHGVETTSIVLVKYNALLEAFK